VIGNSKGMPSSGLLQFLNNCRGFILKYRATYR
jgi:hypothetical protein